MSKQADEIGRERLRDLVRRVLDGDREAAREMQAEYGDHSLSGDVVAALARLAEKIHQRNTDKEPDR